MATQVAPGKKATPSADWRVIFLSDLGAPASKTNLFFLDLWARFEGGINHNNPLNTSLRTQHSTGTWNSSGVQNYDTLANGAHAAASTLLNTPNPFYASIISAFRGNASPATLAARVTASPWDAGHYGAKQDAKGHYIGGNLWNAVVPAIHKPGVGTAIGDVWTYIQHPGRGVQHTATAAEKPVKDTLHYILYGLAIAGGGAMMIVGLILIAADLGLSKRSVGITGPGGIGATVGPKESTPEPTPDERVSAAYTEGKQRGREKRARKLGEMRSQTSRNDVRAEAASRERPYRASREGISKKDSVRTVTPKHDVSRRLRKVK